jgi:hypothetical protein
MNDLGPLSGHQLEKLFSQGNLVSLSLSASQNAYRKEYGTDYLPTDPPKHGGNPTQHLVDIAFQLVEACMH